MTTTVETETDGFESAVVVGVVVAALLLVVVALIVVIIILLLKMPRKRYAQFLSLTTNHYNIFFSQSPQD